MGYDKWNILLFINFLKFSCLNKLLYFGFYSLVHQS